jgi:hypothetical protein
VKPEIWILIYAAILATSALSVSTWFDAAFARGCLLVALIAFPGLCGYADFSLAEQSSPVTESPAPPPVTESAATTPTTTTTRAPLCPVRATSGHFSAGHLTKRWRPMTVKRAIAATA